MSKEKGIIGVVVGAVVVAVGFTAGYILGEKHSKIKERLFRLDPFHGLFGNGVGFGCPGCECGDGTFDDFEDELNDFDDEFDDFDNDFEEKAMESDINEELVGDEKPEEEDTASEASKLEENPIQ